MTSHYRQLVEYYAKLAKKNTLTSRLPNQNMFRLNLTSQLYKPLMI